MRRSRHARPGSRTIHEPEPAGWIERRGDTWEIGFAGRSGVGAAIQRARRRRPPDRGRRPRGPLPRPRRRRRRGVLDRAGPRRHRPAPVRAAHPGAAGGDRRGRAEQRPGPDLQEPGRAGRPHRPPDRRPGRGQQDPLGRRDDRAGPVGSDAPHPRRHPPAGEGEPQPGPTPAPRHQHRHVLQLPPRTAHAWRIGAVSRP